jgi:hypothetical protein
VTATSASGLAVGCHYSFTDCVAHQRRWVALGANLVVHSESSDLVLYRSALKHDLDAIRGAVAGSGSSAGGSGAACGASVPPLAEESVV